MQQANNELSCNTVGRGSKAEMAQNVEKKLFV
jgi:hypothetical protein